MLVNATLLFALTFIAGVTVFFIPAIKTRNFRNLLSFSGAYLFSITVIHILPELFQSPAHHTIVGVVVLSGFFFQILLAYFSTGVEHGHIHNDHHHEGYSGATLLFISLWIHSLLEGTLLVHPHVEHKASDVRNLLFGLILHKIPEAFALVSVLLFKIKHKGIVTALLVVFALSSPVGLIASGFISHSSIENSHIFTYLFAFVAGNFLHISTTIFFEAETPGHSFKGGKLIVTSCGALLAVLAEVL